jgi:hypothetical protein
MTYQSMLRLGGQTPDVTVPALHSLTRSDVAATRIALGDLGWEWSLAAVQDYDGDLSIMISRLHDEDTTFVLYGTSRGICLGKVIHETWEDLGCYARIEEATQEIAAAWTDIFLVLR